MRVWEQWRPMRAGDGGRWIGWKQDGALPEGFERVQAVAWKSSGRLRESGIATVPTQVTRDRPRRPRGPGNHSRSLDEKVGAASNLALVHATATLVQGAQGVRGVRGLQSLQGRGYLCDTGELHQLCANPTPFTGFRGGVAGARSRRKGSLELDR